MTTRPNPSCCSFVIGFAAATADLLVAPLLGAPTPSECRIQHEDYRHRLLGSKPRG